MYPSIFPKLEHYHWPIHHIIHLFSARNITDVPSWDGDLSIHRKWRNFIGATRTATDAKRRDSLGMTSNSFSSSVYGMNTPVHIATSVHQQHNWYMGASKLILFWSWNHLVCLGVLFPNHHWNFHLDDNSIIAEVDGLTIASPIYAVILPKVHRVHHTTRTMPPHFLRSYGWIRRGYQPISLFSKAFKVGIPWKSHQYAKEIYKYLLQSPISTSIGIEIPSISFNNPP